MASVVVSGRLDADVKRRADVVLAQAHVLPGDVIRTVFQNIADTGKIPQREAAAHTRPSLADFFRDCDDLPKPEGLDSLTREGARDLVASRYE